ncbi:MAG: intradiol ring-cleavage dioxygenase [Gammaproteobacteria bacterium]|nr:intradiol ring-cleavage dioxygenase [Gammaproteobacteria bacterium]
MKDFTVDNLTDEVVAAYVAGATSPRLAQVFESLVRHLHAFVLEVELSEGEWFEAIQFLTATGQQCDERRQEFILLSDTLGVSMLVDAINHPKGGQGTESTVLGPFYVEGAPDMPYGGDIRRRHLATAEPCLVTGRVTDADGQPIAGATLDVWQTSANGFYDVQEADAPQWNLRGRFTTNEAGEYALVTEKPVSYPVPTDGPVGRLLAAAGRHAFRPAHIHFIVRAPGCEALVTHVFVDGDPYLDSDAVFATKASLVGEFKPGTDTDLARRCGLDGPHSHLAFDFGLMPAGG